MSSSASSSKTLYNAIRARPWSALFATLCGLVLLNTPFLVFAQQQGILPIALPTGATEGQLLQQFWGWAKYLLGIMAVLIAVGAFLWIAGAIIGKFGDIVENRGNLLSIIPTVGLGLLVLALCAVLITIGWNVLKTTTLTP